MILLRVKEVANQKGISQRQLVLRYGLDIRIVQRVLRNPKANITLATLDRLAQALGVDASELIESVPDDPDNVGEEKR